MGFLNNLFGVKEKAPTVNSPDDFLKQVLKKMMSPELFSLVEPEGRDNGELHRLAQTLSEDQVQELYQMAILSMGTGGLTTEVGLRLFSLPGMAGHPNACAMMGYLQPVVEVVWKDFCGDDKAYDKAYSAVLKLVGQK